jgi:adenylyltransferase/sulfurtransferase
LQLQSRISGTRAAIPLGNEPDTSATWLIADRAHRRDAVYTVTQLIDYQQFCGIAPPTPEEKTLKNGIPQLSVKELKRRIDAGEDVYLIDVREPYEYKIAQIGGKLIPQDEVPRRLAEIDRDREVIVHCHSGVRSQRIAEFLKQAGYPRVVNLIGGIHAWSEEIDPRVQKY